MERGPTLRNTRNIPASLTASVIGIIVTLIAVVISELTGLKEASEFLPFVYGALGVAVVFLVGVNVRAYVRDVNAARAAYVADLDAARAQLHFAELVDHAIPELVTFTSREDVLTLEPDGNARLEWRFDLASPRAEVISDLTFPIYAEVDPETDDWDAISVELVELDEEELHLTLEPREMRRSVDTKRPSLQYYVLRVPVELGENRESCSLRVILRLNGVFPQATDMEAFYVDIPYLTEALRVQLLAPGGKVYRPLKDGVSSVEAMSGLMEVPDPAESASQSKSCKRVGPTLVWTTKAPKLGYRYKVCFRLESESPRAPVVHD